VNLIGEHTDYNMGYVLPAALDKAIYFAIAPAPGGECRVHALDVNQEHRFFLDALHKAQNGLAKLRDGCRGPAHESRIPGRRIPLRFSAGYSDRGPDFPPSALSKRALAFALNEIFPLAHRQTDAREACAKGGE